MNPTLPHPLVSANWLAQNLATPDIIVIDASWYLPAMQRDGHAEYRAGHIPGAIFFDINAISDVANPLPHMLPTSEAFALAMGGLGVSQTMTAIVYDGAGLFSAARVWWMLKLFGAGKVHVLDGGLPAWKQAGGALEAGEAARKPAVFIPDFNAAGVVGMADVSAALAARSAQVLDARAAARFRGEAPEPRPGLPSGHMEGAISLPMTQITANGRLLPPDALRAAFAKAGFDPRQPAITSCGSGVSAAIINLALETTGDKAPALYDGSWTEWASRGMPVATG